MNLVVRKMTMVVAGWLIVAALPALVQAQPIERLPELSQLESLPAEGLPPTEGQYAPQIAPPLDYFDLDSWMAANAGPRTPCEDWHWQVLPEGLIYKSYLAGAKESRLGTQVFSDPDLGTQWDSTLGGRFGVFRYGSCDNCYPQGWQLDVEGSAQVRLNPDEERDLDAADFRVGAPLTYGYGPHRFKFGYYHLSSHVGDEFLERNPAFVRNNYVRDALVLGYAYYWTDQLRLYGEMDWAFYGDLTGNWHFQFGVDYAPSRPTGVIGAPFFALNGHLREELDYSGNFVLEAGWAWRGDASSHLLRTGLYYYNGNSNMYEFYQDYEQQIGAGLWYDY